MNEILVRGLDEGLVSRLEERARRNQRSLEDEARAILEEAAAPPHEGRYDELFRTADRIREQLKGRYDGDSREWIREDRAR